MIALVRDPRVLCALSLVVGTAFVVWALWPVLAIPLHADDYMLYAFWAEGRLRGPWWANLAPDQLFVGPRVVPAGLAALWLWLEATFRFGEWTGIPIDLVWRSWRLILPLVALGAASAFAAAWRLDALRFRGGRLVTDTVARERRGGSVVAFSRVYLAVCLVFGSVVQVHLLWSNDPVTAFALAGWGTATLLFLYLAMLPAALVREGRAGWAWLAAGTGVGLIGVWYYELLLLPPVLGSFLAGIVALRLWTGAGRRAAVFVGLRGLVVGVVPIAIFLMTRIVLAANLTGDQAYSGTVFRLGGQFARTWFAASVSALPGAGWSLSSSFVGPFWGSDHVGLRSTVLTFGLLGAGVWALWLTARRGTSDDDSLGAPSYAPGAASRPWGLGAGSACAVLVAVWLGSAGLHSLTSKYQDEMAGVIGKVYLYYAPASVAVAVLLGVVVIVLARLPWKVPLISIAVLLAVVATQQLAANRLVANAGSATYRGEALAIEAFQDPRRTGAADSRRCAGLRAWRGTGRWPNVDQERFLQDAFELTHGFPMCSADKP